MGFWNRFRRGASAVTFGIVSPITYTFVGSKCGHKVTLEEDEKGLLVGQISAFGYSRKTAVPRTGEGQVEYCLDCLSKMSIHCPFCKNVIMVGDLVTISRAKHVDFVPNSGSKVYKPADHTNRGPQYIACAQYPCVIEFDGCVGAWMPQDDGTATIEFFDVLR